MDRKALVAYAMKNPLVVRMLAMQAALQETIRKAYAMSPVMGTAAFVSLSPIMGIVGTVLIVIIV